MNLLLVPGLVQADSVAQVQTAKRISASTVALIDPESGTSSGGASGDVNYAIGDILTFTMQFTPVPNGSVRGLGGYITEYVPANTEVVGARIIDRDGNTVPPHRGGFTADGWGRRGSHDFDFSPTWGPFPQGSMSQVYADTGIFYSTDPRTVRQPAGALITVFNGIEMVEQPTGAGQLDQRLGIPNGGPFFAHNQWDWVQAMGFGTDGEHGSPLGGDITDDGKGNTPFLYGSAVAGPLTFYPFEATEVVATGDIYPLGNNGPWQRIAYPGSEIGAGVAATSDGWPPQRVGVPTSAGWDLSVDNPLPAGTNTVRYAVGELVVGDEYFAEISLRVLASPLDPGLMADANCAEVFGGDGSSHAIDNGGKDNSWRYFVPAPACVLLNLFFELDVDKILAITGEDLDYTITLRNLSTTARTNVVVTDLIDTGDVAFVSATPPPASVAGGLITWPTIPSLAPGEERIFTVRSTVTGTGGQSTLNTAKIVSDQLPDPGFSTVALTNLGQRALPVLSLAATPDAVMAGDSFTYDGTIRNAGNGDATADEYRVTLPAGFTIVPGTSQVNGAGIADPTLTASGYYLYTAGLEDLSPGETAILTFDVSVAGGVAEGIYTSCLETWHADVGFGRDVNDSVCQTGEVAVGGPRSDAPVVNPALANGMTCVGGTTSEADGTTVEVFLNGVSRGTAMSAGGVWTVCGLPALFGGMHVTATATATGESPSPKSAPVVVSASSTCSDGADNDGDGLVDFPADPGCSSPVDGDEADTPQCSDTLDNDGDLDFDWPADLECDGPDDNTEAGPPACGDGLDNDGDGLVDFPADPDCVDAADRSEVNLRTCQNGLDDDGDGLFDFPEDPGCHSANDSDETDPAPPADIAARLLLLFDTSGSMNWNTCTNTFTGGDGSLECAGGDVSCAACSASGCGNGIEDDSRIDRAKRGLTDVVGAYGEVEYGLMRFHQRPAPFTCPSSNASQRSGGWQGAGAEPCGGGFSAGDLLVGFSQENSYDLLEYMDGQSNYPGTPPAGQDWELRGTGTTPLGGSLGSALTYLEATSAADPVAGCRPYRVILLTDGEETCAGDPVGRAAALTAAGFNVHVIGFAIGDPTVVANLNAIAAAGGTTSAIFVDDSTTLSAAITDIIIETVRVEVCNGVDDDCDVLIDEGFPLYCNRPGGVTTASLCADPGETVCNGVDDNCDGVIDEGLVNACGDCGTLPAETCNGVDDDCDGPIDEGACSCPAPEPEVCDAFDNDCDGPIDEGITRPCGTAVGECTTGVEVCTTGTFGTCSGTGPTAETCDNLDNDCDGVVDGIPRSCGTDVGACQTGTELCTAGSFDGVCVGSIGPTPELCNLVDDDCNGVVDDGNPGGGGMCGSAIGECSPGTNTCVGGSVVCTGGVGPTPETCDGQDDDCDGRTDEGVPTMGACGTCGDGVLTCTGGSFTCVGDRAPGTEVCNGVDDDCDGSTDEGDPGGGLVCGSDVGECSPGTTACVGGAIVCQGATGPGPESCNLLDDDCDALIDEGNPDGGAGCGASAVGECELGVDTCMGGSVVCIGETTSTMERCDSLDNDCDGSTDEGNPGGGMTCGDDTGECTPGVLTCTAGLLTCGGEVGPTAEVCNGLDDDCDGVVDDGLDVGAPCGSDVGECVPGLLICVGGSVVCDGEVGPEAETCNALDDDCDSLVDESLPLGSECGVTMGACVPGMLQCIGGAEACVGEVPRAREGCDCEDNDCDGSIDEAPDTGDLCPAGSSCIDCECALPCVDSEFGRCPAGRVPVEDEAGCHCAAPACDSVTCAEDTISTDDVTRCAPDDPMLPACECRANECTFPCSGVTCAEPTVCNPFDGTCVEDGCRGLGCPAGELCDFDTLLCSPDPCSDVTCAADEACRGGACEASCATVSCPGGESCSAGACAADACAATVCPAREVCDPATGGCVVDMCLAISCPGGAVCDSVTGLCVIDPCVGLVCPEDEFCRGGECAMTTPPPPPDAGPPPMPDASVGEDGGLPDSAPTMDATVDPERRVLATGGGGCGCRTTGGGGAPASAALVLLTVLGLAHRRRGEK